MIGYVARKVLESLGLMLGVLVLVFFLVRLTGDPVALMVPKDAPQEQREVFAERMGLNRPLPVQFADYLGGVLRGDFGDSLRQKRPAVEIVFERLRPTLELALGALAFAALVAIPLGLAAGMRPHGTIDNIARGVGLAGQTVPNYWLGMLLIVLFAVELRWFPVFGRDSWRSMVLPAVSLGFAGMGQLLRLTRSAVLEVRRSDYLRTARAKGLPATRLAWLHVLPNVAIPLLSVLGIQFTYLLGGSVYIESVFAWPGLGTLLENAIRDTDFPLVQAITAFIAFVAIAVHLVTDLLYGLIDPRMRVA
jgi:peptide/nickel transport system permease protein